MKRSVAIIGAGPAGLVAADYLADLHQVHLFESGANVGGVWAEHDGADDVKQAYPWLETNTPKALFPFPSFPLINDDWSAGGGESKSQHYVPARVAQNYYRRFAAEKRLEDGNEGRLAGLYLSTRVKCIARCDEDASTWSLTTVKDGKEQERTFSKVIVATGSFRRSRIPKWAQDIHAQQVVHSSRLGQAHFTDRICRAKRIVVVGNGKSALDVIAHTASLVDAQKASRSLDIILVRRPGSDVKAWPVPHGRVPSILSRMPLLGSGRLSPWPLARQSWSDSRLGQWAIKTYWSMLAFSTRMSHPRLFDESDNVSGAHMLDSAARVFPAPQGLEKATCKTGSLRVIRGDIERLDKDKEDAALGIVFRADSTKEVKVGAEDLVILCTGYEAPDIQLHDLISDANLALDVGLPRKDPPQEWQEALANALRAFYVPKSHDRSAPTFRLHRHMVPYTDISSPRHLRNFAIMGLPQTLSANIVSEMQARWLQAYFANDAMLTLPQSFDEGLQETARLVAASIARYGARDCRRGTAMAMELQWYADLLLADVQGKAAPPRSALRPLTSIDWR